MNMNAAKRPRGRPSLSGPSPASDETCLDVALEAFAERGYEGASIRDIAAASGVSHGLITARFGSKQGLWMAAVDHGMSRLHQRLVAVEQAQSAQIGVEERMRTVCIRFLETVAAYPAIVQLMNVEGSRPGPRLSHIVETFFRSRSWPFATLLAEGQASGLFRPIHVSVPFTLLAHGAGALVALRPLVEAVNASLRTDPEGLSRTIEAAADMIVRGLKA
jgi:TetR/AcrR family transcriptional regulator